MHMYTGYFFHIQGVMEGTLWVQKREGFQRMSWKLLKTYALVLSVGRGKGKFYWLFSVYQELPNVFSPELLTFCKEDIKDLKKLGT